MSDTALYNLPLAVAYPQLNPEQAYCLRHWLWDCFQLDARQHIRAIIGYEDRKQTSDFVIAYKYQQDPITPDQQSLLTVLIDIARAEGCDSILKLFAEILAEHEDFIDDAKLDSLLAEDDTQLEAAEDMSTFMESIASDTATDLQLFPGLIEDRTLFREIQQRRQPVAQVPEIKIKRPKPRIH